MGTSEIKVSIEVQNIDQYKTLLKKAKKESDQLQKTIDQIREFNFETELKS